MKAGLSLRVLVPILTAVFSGVGVLLFTSDWEATARLKGWVPTAEWQAGARRQDWIPQNECPAFPVSVSLTSPGNGADVSVDAQQHESTLYTDIVIKVSRPLPVESSVGLVFNQQGSPNYQVVFPYFTVDRRRVIFRDDKYVSLPFHVTPDTKLSVWAIVVANKNEYGSTYSALEQVRAVRDDAVISQKATIGLKLRE